MGEPAILFVKPKAISQSDKKSLRAAGVLVIEIDDPANAKFTRAGSEIDSTEMLSLAARAIRQSDYTTQAFGKLLCAALDMPKT